MYSIYARQHVAIKPSIVKGLFASTNIRDTQVSNGETFGIRRYDVNDNIIL